MLNELTLNAVNESRFDDASYYYWILSMQYAEMAREDERMVKKFREFQTKANMYYAYHTIQRYTDEPFTSYMPEALFNIARWGNNYLTCVRGILRQISCSPRYLMHELLFEQPKGVSKFSVHYALAKQARNLGAYKLSRLVMEKIQKLVIPKRFRENVDLAALMIRSKPYYDNEELLSICYRCSTTNPLYNAKGNRCNNCGQPFIYSFVSFEILPLVEFQLEEGIGDREACTLIETSAGPEDDNGGGRRGGGPGLGDSQTMIMGEDDMEDDDDPFSNKLFSFQQDGGGPGGVADQLFSPVVVGRKTLLAMEPGDVIIFKWEPPLSYQFFKNIMPDMSITKCDGCNRVFHTDDYELQLLQKGHCPFCRTPAHFLNASGGGATDGTGIGGTGIDGL